MTSNQEQFNQDKSDARKDPSKGRKDDASKGSFEQGAKQHDAGQQTGEMNAGAQKQASQGKPGEEHQKGKDGQQHGQEDHKPGQPGQPGQPAQPGSDANKDAGRQGGVR